MLLFRFLARPDELDKLFHLQIVKNKKKLDKKKEDALMYFLIPLIHNDSGLSDKKGWSEFRESLETTFAPVVGSWKDKKGKNARYIPCVKVQHNLLPRMKMAPAPVQAAPGK